MIAAMEKAPSGLPKLVLAHGTRGYGRLPRRPARKISRNQGSGTRPQTALALGYGSRARLSADFVVNTLGEFDATRAHDTKPTKRLPEGMRPATIRSGKRQS